MRSRRRAAVLTIGLAAFFSPSKSSSPAANAQPSAREIDDRTASVGEAFFLASSTKLDAGHVPLAVVRNGQVGDAVPRPAKWPAVRPRDCGPRSRWAVVGSRWHALDGWGQIVGTGIVRERPVYDVTRCAELALSLSPAGTIDGRTLFVSEDSAWRPSPSPAFSPSAAVRESFRALVAGTINDRPAGRAALHPQCAAIKEREHFFGGPAGERYAIGTSNIGYVVARLDGERWTPVATRIERYRAHPEAVTCYRPVAIFDMNQDGVPEVVLRQSAAGEAWGDLVLGRDPDGGWSVVAISPGTAVI
jgi:hypothetical protein